MCDTTLHIPSWYPHEMVGFIPSGAIYMVFLYTAGVIVVVFYSTLLLNTPYAYTVIYKVCSNPQMAIPDIWYETHFDELYYSPSWDLHKIINLPPLWNSYPYIHHHFTWACLKMVYIHVYTLVGMMTMGFGGINMFRPGGWQAHKKDPFSTRDGWICYTVSRVPLSKSSGVLPCASHAGEKSWKAWCWIESSWAGSVVIMELSSSYRRWSSMGPAMPSLLIGGFKDFLQHWIFLYIFGMIVPAG